MIFWDVCLPCLAAYLYLIKKAIERACFKSDAFSLSCSPINRSTVGQQQQYHPQPQREQRDREPAHPREQQSRDQQPVRFIMAVPPPQIV
jgi:hypothetical protein